MRTTARLSHAQKIDRAVELHLQGSTWDEVARECGYSSRQNACRAVRQWLGTHPSASVEEMRETENQRYDRIERHLNVLLARHHIIIQQGRVVGRFVGFAKIPGTDEVYIGNDGKPIPLFDEIEDDDPDMRIIAQLIRVWERRAKLNGLDKPIRVSLEGDSEIDQEIEDLVSSMTGPLDIAEGHPG